MLADLATGAVLDAARAEEAFVPASVSKLVTALYALDRLGPDHRFETRLLATGPVAEGRLDGDLVLEGTGDPELDSDGLVALLDEARAAGLAAVGGRFLVDATALPPIEAISEAQPVDATYNPGLSGLNLNFNRVRMRWEGKAVPTVTALAETADPPVTAVRVRAVPGRGVARLRLGDRVETWDFPSASLRGTGSRWLPVRRPALYAGDVLRQIARAAGLDLPEPEEAPTPARARPIARLEGRPLVPVLQGMLKFSTNVTAEALGLAATAADSPGLVPSLAVSARAMSRWAAGRLGMDEPAGLALANHSGLSLDSRMSPAATVALLVASAGQAPPAEAAHPRIPGRAGALLPDYRIWGPGLPDSLLAAEVRAKTGTMDQVRGLAGYLVTPGRRVLAFAIFSNRLEARERTGRRFDRGWSNRATHFERSLLQNWALRFDTAGTR